MTHRDLDFLMNDFVGRVPQVAHVVAVTADGLLVARNQQLPLNKADPAAAALSGLVSLLTGAGRYFEAGQLGSGVVEFSHGFLFIMSVSNGAVMAFASPRCDIGQVSTELAELINKVGPALTPATRQEMLDAAASGR